MEFMSSEDRLLKSYAAQIRKSLKHLKYSFQKSVSLSTDIATLSEEDLETWESLAARFSRTSDLFVTTYLRRLVQQKDPGFSGSLRDSLDLAEKWGLIDDAKVWLKIREFRNRVAHEYTEEDLKILYEDLRALCPSVLKIEAVLDS